MTTRKNAFSLIELLIAVAIVAVLVALGIGASHQALAGAKKADSLARLRSVGQAVLTHAGEHDSRLPGPLWPGQVMYYDAAREGRIVRDLAPYLEIPHRDAPYVVDRMIPKAFLPNPTAAPLADLRVYVMNSTIVLEGQTNLPFGSLTLSPPVEPLKLGRLTNLPEGERWMISETDQSHDDVSSAPWKANTPAKPVHDGFRASVNFDGSANLETAK
jgi:prepilin-type N-terminal cleavage/methylation domain-containing protein